MMQAVRGALRGGDFLHTAPFVPLLPPLPPHSAVWRLPSRSTATSAQARLAAPAAAPSFSPRPRRCLSTASSSPSAERGTLSSLFRGRSSIQFVEDDLELRSLLRRHPNKLVVVDWFATWCGPCRAILPVYEQLSVDNQHVLFIGADIEEMPDASAQAGVQAVPCFHFIKGNELVAVLTGADESKLKELVKQHG